MAWVNGLIRISWSFQAGDPYVGLPDSQKKKIKKRILREIARKIPAHVLERWNGWVFRVDKDGHKPEMGRWSVEDELEGRVRQDLSPMPGTRGKPGPDFTVGPFDEVGYHTVDRRVCCTHTYDLLLNKKDWVIRPGKKVEAWMKIQLEWDTPLKPVPSKFRRLIPVPRRLPPAAKARIRRPVGSEKSDR